MTRAYDIRVLRPDDGSVIVEVTGRIDIAGSLSFGERLCAVLNEEATKPDEALGHGRPAL